MTQPTTISNLLQAASQGNSDAAQQLWASVYDELRRIAQRAVDREYARGSLQATELAHEAFLKLSGKELLGLESRAHLLAVVAKAIRRLLVDRARARKAEKRGGELQRITLDDVLDNTPSELPELLDLDMALQELEKTAERCAKLVELRIFTGMTLEEAATMLQISTRTAAGDWAYTKAWLRRRLDGADA